MSEVFGIDVSHYQGRINWQQVAGDNKKFAILKCQYEAQSHRIDEYFESNYAEAGKYGIARGVYIYIARASMADPVGDAQALLNHLKGRKLEYGIWIDLEDSTLGAKGKGFIRDLAYKYSDIFIKAGYYVGIYCNRDWYIRLIHDDLKRDFDFWIARYPKNDVGKYNKNSSLKPGASVAVAWQYSSKGNVAGITTHCDLDVDYDGTIELIVKAAQMAPEVSNPYPRPTRLLKLNCKGGDVKWLQFALNQHGASLKIDGIFGLQTKLSVLLFQKDNGLRQDAIVGPRTIEKLVV